VSDRYVVAESKTKCPECSSERKLTELRASPPAYETYVQYICYRCGTRWFYVPTDAKVQGED
jgi:DNA-directed RNA polymerase subunit RPC12/RpoP